MSAEEFIKQGNLDGALNAARAGVKADPADPKARIALFQIQSVLGLWEKARDQLEVLQNMDPEPSLFAHIFTPVVECEAIRKKVFEGKTTPVIFGEPEDWMGLLVHANELAARGEYAAAERTRLEAFEAAPASPGAIDDTPFEWIADADSRLGPMLEVILEECYRWVPFSRISRIRIEPPSDLRDLVWTPARFTWVNGGTASGFIPTRYPGSEGAEDPAICLSRRTDWVEKPGSLFLGRGQRELVTDQQQFALLAVRSIDFAAQEAAATEVEDHA